MEVPPSIGAATASNAGVVTPDAANRSAQSPRSARGAYTVAQRCGHGFEAGASDAGGVGHAGETLGRRQRPQLGEDRARVDQLGVGTDRGEQRTKTG